MKNPIVLALLSVGCLVGLVGCGQSICTRAADLAKNNCTAPNTPSDFVTKCEAKLDKCTAADTAAMNKAYDCVAKLGKCTADAGADYGTKVIGCYTSSGTVSAACTTALSGG